MHEFIEENTEILTCDWNKHKAAWEEKKLEYLHFYR